MSEIKVNRWLFEDTGQPVGCIIQSVLTRSSALQTMTTTIPADDTIPTSSEGTEITGLTTNFTPKKIGNKIRVTINLFFCTSSSISFGTCALFKNSDVSAVAVAAQGSYAASAASSLTCVHEETVSSLSQITFKVRLGPSSATTISVNGLSGVRVFGGTATSSMLIEEIQA